MGLFNMEQNNRQEVEAALEEAINRGLRAVGLQVENYARMDAPIDTGALRNSITSAVGGEDAPKEDEPYVIIGSNLEYAPYVELGTGIHAMGGNGRRTPWSYRDDLGKWHRTSGQVAQPYLRPAVNDHIQEYENIIKSELER